MTARHGAARRGPGQSGAARHESARPGTGTDGRPEAGARPGRRPQAVAGPTALVLIGIVSVQVGAGLATRLFHELPPAAVTGLRLWSAAAFLLIFGGRRARGTVAGLVERRAWRDAAIALSFGICLGGMNFVFYQAIARIPLGVAVTIEFLGPLAVAVAGSRRLLDLLWVALAGTGVVLLTGGDTAQLSVPGVIFAALSAVGWAAYIVLSAATGRRFPGSSGLVIAMLIAAVVVTPGALATANGSLRKPVCPRDRRGRGPAVIGDPLRRRTPGAAAAVDPGVRHLDEPRAGGGGTHRADFAGPAPVGQRMGRRRLRGHRLHRRRPLRAPVPGAAPHLRPRAANGPRGIPGPRGAPGSQPGNTSPTGPSSLPLNRRWPAGLPEGIDLDGGQAGAVGRGWWWPGSAVKAMSSRSLQDPSEGQGWPWHSDYL